MYPKLDLLRNTSYFTSSILLKFSKLSSYFWVDASSLKPSILQLGKSPSRNLAHLHRQTTKPLTRLRLRLALPGPTVTVNRYVCTVSAWWGSCNVCNSSGAYSQQWHEWRSSWEWHKICQSRTPNGLPAGRLPADQPQRGGWVRWSVGESLQEKALENPTWSIQACLVHLTLNTGSRKALVHNEDPHGIGTHLSVPPPLVAFGIPINHLPLELISTLIAEHRICRSGKGYGLRSHIRHHGRQVDVSWYQLKCKKCTIRRGLRTNDIKNKWLYAQAIRGLRGSSGVSRNAGRWWLSWMGRRHGNERKLYLAQVEFRGNVPVYCTNIQTLMASSERVRVGRWGDQKRGAGGSGERHWAMDHEVRILICLDNGMHSTIVTSMNMANWKTALSAPRQGRCLPCAIVVLGQKGGGTNDPPGANRPPGEKTQSPRLSAFGTLLTTLWVHFWYTFFGTLWVHFLVHFWLHFFVHLWYTFVHFWLHSTLTLLWWLA